ncbi:MAG: YceI family protein [Pseudomonadota bacterium]
MNISRNACRWAVIFAIGLGFLGVRAQAAPQTYELDVDHFSIGFLVDHIGYAKVLGLFRKAKGSIVFDEDSGEVGDVWIEIDTQSVFSNHRKRDDHLRGADFLNASEFPTMTFRAKGATSLGERRYEIKGELELIGRRQPLTLQATWNKAAEYPFSRGILAGKPWVIGLSARGAFNRSDFGMSYAVDNGLVGDRVDLIIELEAIRQN